MRYALSNDNVLVRANLDMISLRKALLVLSVGGLVVS